MFKRLYSLHYFIMSKPSEHDKEPTIEEINKEQMKLVIKYTYTSINTYLEKKIEDDQNIANLRTLNECIDSYSTCIRYLRMFHEAVDQLYKRNQS